MNCDDYPDLLWSYYILFAYLCGLGCLRTTFCVFCRWFPRTGALWSLDILTEAEVTAVLRAFQKGRSFRTRTEMCMAYPLSIFIHLCPPFMAILLRRLWYVVINPMCQSQGGLKDVERPLSTASKQNPAWMTWLSFIVWCTGIYIYDVESCSFYLESTPHSGPGETISKITLLRVIPIVTNIFSQFLTSSFGSIYMAYIFWHSLLAFYLTLYSWHPIWHSFCIYSDTDTGTEIWSSRLRVC